MKYTRAQIKEALRTSRAKWVVPEKGEKVLRSNEKCGFCEMVGNNFDVTGGRNSFGCEECQSIFWDDNICIVPISDLIGSKSMNSEDSDWPEACRIMQSEFDRIEQEFCEPKVYVTECYWQDRDGWVQPFRKSGHSKDGSSKTLSFVSPCETEALIGKRTKLTIEVLD